MSCLTTLTPPGWQGPADGVPCCWATMDGDWGGTHCPRGHILEPPNLVLGALARGGRNCLACGRAAREVSRLRSLGKTVTPDERQRISDRKFAALTGLTICDCDKDTR